METDPQPGNGQDEPADHQRTDRARDGSPAEESNLEPVDAEDGWVPL